MGTPRSKLRGTRAFFLWVIESFDTHLLGFISRRLNEFIHDSIHRALRLLKVYHLRVRILFRRFRVFMAYEALNGELRHAAFAGDRNKCMARRMEYYVMF